MSDDEDNFQSYGTLLEPYDEDEIPKKKAFSIEDQIATDDQGRRRFHGAFTGGFSAGFFNTVGSLEGWKPSEFKSSRSEKADRKLQKPQDFMDEEDTGQFGIAPSVVRATSDYSNTVKRNKRTMKTDGPIPGVPVLDAILQPAKETLGIKLLKMMGWKPGQGVGPRVSKIEKRRMNRENKISTGKVYGCEIPEEFRKSVDSDKESSEDDTDITFAPDDYDPFIYKPKDNTFGMGYTGLDKRPILSSHINLFAPSEFKMRDHKNQKISISGQAFGVGAFEHEDEDIYAGEDMSKYDFELESSRKKNKKKAKPIEKSKENIIEGFILSKNPFSVKKAFPPPVLPKNFIPKHGARISRFEPLPDTHKMFNYDRTKTMGRHDLSSQQRSKILNSSSEVITTKNNQTPIETLLSKTLNTSIEKEKEIIKEKAKKITNVLPSTPVGPFKPFMIHPEKQKRYEEYLSLLNLGQENKLPDIQPAFMTDQEKEREKYEFGQAARMFKPVSGLVFDKFVAASESNDSLVPARIGRSVYEHGTPEMREAAKNKMFGQLTRNIEVWRPNKLLCKRFNVPDPDISESELSLARRKKNKFNVFDYYEAYQQNKVVKEGPEPKKIVETSENPEEILPETSEKVINPALARYITFRENNQKAKSDELKSTVISTTPNVDIVSDESLNIPSTSSSIPPIESNKTVPEENIVIQPPNTPLHSNISFNRKAEPLIYKINTPPAAPITLPTDPKEKRDLFKAIFLSSSDESENEKEDEPQNKPEEKIIEMKKILLEEEPKNLSSETPNSKPNKGIFADLDWSKINKNRNDNLLSREEKKNDVEEDNANDKNKVLENQKEDEENLFGPKLPAQIPKQTTNASPWKPLFTNKKSVEDSSSSDDEWMELDSSQDKTNKKISKKHKKHKSKHKKHKSKHKKKKHSDRH